MGQDATTTNPPGPLNDEEAELLSDFRRCSPRRQEAIRRFAHKLAVLEAMPGILDLHTNILEFRRRKDD